MPAFDNEGKNRFLRATSVPVCQPCQALLVPVSKFPIPEEELPPIRHFLEKLTTMAAKRWELSSEVFIQVEQSDEPNGRALYVRYARRWIPEIGLGVWPDREPPKSWTKEEFTSLQPGETLRPLMHQVFRVTKSPQAKQEANDVLLAFGPILRVMIAGDGETYLQNTSALLLPPITDPSYTCFPFYVPLMDLNGLTSAGSEQLLSWFCGASLYIRESFEDQGILIASREQISPLLTELGGVYEEQPDPGWRIPILT